MFKYIPLLLIAVFLLACGNNTYYRTSTGLVYQIISSEGKDSIARMGNTAKIHFIQKLGDSVIEDNYSKMPFYYMVLPGISPYNPMEAFDYGLKEGDSVLAIQVVDTMLKKGVLKKLAPWMKKGDEWKTTFKVEKVFRSDSLLQIDKKQERGKVTQLQKSLGTARIQAYLKSHGIRSKRTDKPVYVEMVQQGTGTKADTGKYLSIHYKITTLSGRILNSTMDTGFHQKDPAGFILGNNFFPRLVEEQLKGISSGSTVRLYIPGVLIFGLEPSSGELKEDDDMIFELQLTDVSDKAPIR